VSTNFNFRKDVVAGNITIQEQEGGSLEKLGKSENAGKGKTEKKKRNLQEGVPRVEKGGIGESKCCKKRKGGNVPSIRG